MWTYIKLAALGGFAALLLALLVFPLSALLLGLALVIVIGSAIALEVLGAEDGAE